MSELAERQMEAAQISMGHGKVSVGVIYWGDRKGLLLSPQESYIPIGEPGAISGDYWPTKNDVVIWIDAPEGADTILSELASLGTLPEAAARIRELEAAAKPFADLDVTPGGYVVCVAVLDDPDFDGADVLRLRQALGGDNG